MQEAVLKYRPAGYTYLLTLLDLSGMPHWHTSFVAYSGAHRSNFNDGIVEEIYPHKYWPGDTVGAHLEFALKYDGVSLSLLALIFNHLSLKDLTNYINSKPTGKYARKIWFFYEFLSGKKLPIDDLTMGNYVDALDAKQYYTIQAGEKSQRHRIVNNLLGPQSFCPVVRKTESLLRVDCATLGKKCDAVITAYPPEMLRRALSYLYSKETKSSFAIERITPNTSRVERFIQSLELAEKEDFCDKHRLIDLQNLIVDPRFKDSDYRSSQNYVGQSVAYQREVIHYVSPKPADLGNLMAGLIESNKRMREGNVSALIHAAVIAYGFVFLHPFEDGNGRIHRFLIHNILALRKMVPSGLMFPVSAVMLKNPADYDASLEAFSRPLLQLIDYRLNDLGQLSVENDSGLWYRYMDMTAQSEALQGFVIKTIEEELVEELVFLANYDTTKQAIQKIIDMPDRMIDLFIQLCLQNNGTLSARKKAAHFDFLTPEELLEMEQAVKDGYCRVDT